MELNMEYEILKCNICGCDRKMTKGSAYEAKRLGKNACRECSLKNRKRKKSKYHGMVWDGMTNGEWTIISDNIVNSYVKCRCSCGSEVMLRVPDFLSNDSHNRCKKCCIGENATNWDGFGNLPKSVVTKIKLRAKLRGKKFNLSGEYLWELYQNQNGKCALSGIDIGFTALSEYNLSNPHISASLDRIDSSKGYIQGNVQWVHSMVNIMKNEFSEKEFLEMCKHITNYDKSKNI